MIYVVFVVAVQVTTKLYKTTIIADSGPFRCDEAADCSLQNKNEKLNQRNKDIMAKRIAKKVVWIGWDAADWKMINPLLDQGLMPNLELMVNEGVMGNLATLDPPMSPTLWTAMATGKRPYKHGIHGFTEVDPSGTGVRPSYITSRKVKAIWNMMQHHGLKTHQVGWWPSHPAEPTNGIYISNFWHKAGKDPKNWPLPPNSVHPKEMEDIFADLRIHPSELTAAHLQPFIPLGHEIDQSIKKYGQRINSVKKVTADAACIQSAATYIMENHDDYDLMCVYFDAIDHYGHGFMKYNPPRRPHIPEDLYKYFKDVNISGYRFHDMILGRLLEIAGQDAIVILVSDHGFHPDHLRPKSLPIKEEPAAPALEHSPYGIFVAKGPGIKKDERIYGASLIDMCPTILSMFGLPVAKDFDGKVLMNIYEEPIAVDVIESWEDIEGECGQHPKDVEIDVEQSKEEMQQLIDLGYIEDPGADKEKAVEQTKKYNNYFLARAFIDGGRQEDALPLFEELWEQNRDNSRFGVRLANCYMALDMTDEAREIVDAIIEIKIQDTPSLSILNGSLLLKEKKYQLAVKEFEKAFEASPKSAGINLQMAQCYMRLNNGAKAKEAALRELEINYDNPQAHFLIGKVYFGLKEYEAATEFFLNAIGLRYHFPQAHASLGEVLFHLEQYEASAQAFEISLRLFNEFNKSREWLIRIYKNKLNRPDKVAELQQEIKEILESRKTVNIVSGFRRSGTSLMMRMLEMGGQALHIDDSRPADKHNPYGYYEHNTLNKIHFEKGFLQRLDNKVAKVYTPKLPFVPRRILNYKVVLMDRPLTDIALSLQKMQQKNPQQKKGMLNLVLYNKLIMQEKRVNKWLERTPNIEVLRIPYDNLLDNPMEYAQQVNAFLGGHLDVDAMVKAIDLNIEAKAVELEEVAK